uniref:LOW QUALITY PROTEIN: endoribonuclease Dicer-like n=1 Tax=Saccoglossus kowalevskii TaxID=10224 RepID=A0ABM0MVW0_SACKO|nr:PREDICTED: LOW QUALITY PROTEIN: endoribonuclease Dicer-like [Saccoglossus kowalevskii]
MEEYDNMMETEAERPQDMDIQIETSEDLQLFHQKTIHNFTPRAYQVELLERALDKNTVVCLQTGSGKTFIAVMLIKELAHQIRTSYDNGDGGKMTFFLVNSVPLVSQQANVIRTHTDLTVGEYVDAMDVDLWKKDKWNQEFSKHQVLVMTCQIFLDLLLHGMISLSSVNLMIFDECHHAIGNHPYREIMKIYDVCPKTSYPRILGLTSSILNGKCDPTRLEKKLGELEMTMRGTAETATDSTLVGQYGARPKEVVIYCQAFQDENKLAEEINTILQNARMFLEDCSFTLEDNERDPRVIPKSVLLECQSTLSVLGPWCTNLACQVMIRELEKVEFHSTLGLSKLFIRFAMTTLRFIYMRCTEVFGSTQRVNLKYVTPKVLKLLEILKQFKPQPEENPPVEKQDCVEKNGILGNDSTADTPSDTNMELPPNNVLVDNKLASCNAVSNTEVSAVEDNSSVSAPAVNNSRITTQENNTPSGRKQQHKHKHLNHYGDQHIGTGLSSLCGIVFVQQRYTAVVLNQLLKDLSKQDPDLAYLSTSYITGRSIKSTLSVNPDMEYKKQEEVLRRFRRHETNLLVATSVVEEGVDVPKCNLVIRFDSMREYRSYVQSKGRARAPESFFIMMVYDEEKEAFIKDLKQYKFIDRILERICHGKESPAEEDIDAHMVDSLLPQYTPNKQEGGARVTMSSSIPLINRYCAKLPSDAFTHLTPKCKTVQLPNTDPHMYQSILYLPINSPLRQPVQGPPMKGKKFAEMAVALKTCELLHKAGELDENLLPVGKEVVPYEDRDMFEEEMDADGPRPGTTKRRQYYCKQVADSLQNGLPGINKPCYLYVIKMKLALPLPDILNTRGRKLYCPEDSEQGFGILISKKIPGIPSFPVYTRSGKVTVSMELASSGLRIPKDKVIQIRKFHKCIFSEVLRLEKPSMKFDPAKSLSKYYIVPLLSDIDLYGAEIQEIDWSFLELISQCSGDLDNPKPVKYTNNAPYTFDPAKYEDAVVTPTYRNFDQPQRYYVAEISELSPISKFPSTLYPTFAEYYFQRYALEVTTASQHLLDVDYMSSRLNLLTPRYLNHKGKALPVTSAQTKKEKQENLQNKQFLVPELCYIYPIPGSLWRKAVCLPSMLYRLNGLLIAVEVRDLVAQEAKVGIEKLSDDFKFDDLSFGWDEFEINKQAVGDIRDAAGDSDEIESTGTSDDDDEDFYDFSDAIEFQVGDETLQALNQLKMLPDGEEPIKTFNNIDHDSIENDSGWDDSVVDVQHLISFSGTSSRVAPVTIPAPAIDAKDDELDIDIFAQMDTFDFKAATGDFSKSLKHKAATEKISSERLGTIYENDYTEPLIPPDKLDDSTNDDELTTMPGPNPALILQALTMSNASDGFNLERLEMLGDSFLKQAVTTYLYCAYPGMHEGKLSYMRSKQVSNLNLYRLGKKHGLPSRMVVSLFDPPVNWLPPGYVVLPPEKRQPVRVESGFEIGYWGNCDTVENFKAEPDVPYDLHSEQSLSDKSVADCVESLIGCYLVSCGFRGTLLFMSWLGIKVLPSLKDEKNATSNSVGIVENGIQSTGNNTEEKMSREVTENDQPNSVGYGHLKPPNSPLFINVAHAEERLKHLLSGFESFEERIHYAFNDKAYLLQAFTHASYYHNTVTDCYQRLEFLGDAILDYLITKHLYDHHQHHSPGALTDLRSALVNNTIFASLAVKYDYHKYFKAIAPELFHVIDNFVKFQHATEETQGIDSQLNSNFSDDEDEEEDGEEREDIEVPKALGDVFESVAGAIYLDSNMSLDAVWRVYYTMMKPHIDKYSAKVPISPVRELLEMEPETARFGLPEKTMDGKTRVTVTVAGKGTYRGIGRNYRIAKSAAARRALRALKAQQEKAEKARAEAEVEALKSLKDEEAKDEEREEAEEDEDEESPQK